MAPSKSKKDLVTLAAAISNTQNLIRAFQTPNPSTTPPNLGPCPHPNPLAVLSDTSKILKAQTTKLSLLLLNKPFTPGEISHVLNALGNSCLPALATILDLCPADSYTNFLRQHINTCISTIWRELLTLLNSIPQNEEGAEKLENGGTLQSTGVLWATCDNLIRVGADGVAVVASDAVRDNQALLHDAIDELDEWDPEEDDEDDSENDHDDDDAGSVPPVLTPTTSDDEAIVDAMRKTTLNPIFASKARALKHLRLVRLLCVALIKHRVRTFPNINCSTTEADLPTLTNVRVFDDILRGTQSFTEEADEIAGALYAGEPEEVDRRVKIFVTIAKACINLCRLSYEGKEDAFTEWTQIWIARSEVLESWK